MQDTVQSSLLPGSVHVSTSSMDSSSQQQRRPGAMRKKVVICLCLAVTAAAVGGTCFNFLRDKPVSDEGSNKPLSDEGSVAAHQHRMERSTKPQEGVRQEDHDQSATTPSQDILDDRRYKLDKRLKKICKRPQEQYIKVDGTSDQYVPVKRCACNACGHGYTCQPTKRGITTVKRVIKDEKKSREMDEIIYKEVDIEAHTKCSCKQP